MPVRFAIRLAAVAVLALPVSSPADAAETKPLTFEVDIRPIFRSHCYDCHGSIKEKKGKLDLRLARFMIAGGETGPAIVPGAPDKSFLVKRLRDGSMPPGDMRVSAEEISKIAEWIRQGAKTARPEPKQIGDGLGITPEERSWWAFQPISRPPVPVSVGKGRVRTEIDAFVLARLKEKKLGFAADADRLTLVRRVYLDLLGLPPTFEQAQAFINDKRDDAYQRLVDTCLESPHYGERWGRHWLDVAGYADSEGYTDVDTVRDDAYKYRDYVIRSLNNDKPLDVFIQEQLAGDEIVRPPYEELSPADIDRLVATGFLRMAPDGTGSPDGNTDVARNEVMAKTVQIVSSSLLGLTVACAQCHNHRYDPIPHADYYRMRAIFEPAYDWKNWRTPKQRRVSLYTEADRERAKQIELEATKIDQQRVKIQEQYIQRTLEKELAKLADELREQAREARATPVDSRSDEQTKLLRDYPSLNVSAGSLYLYDKKAADDLKAYADRAAKVRATKPVEPFVRALSEPIGKSPPPTYLFDRGDYQQPRQQVSPGELTVLTSFRPLEVPVNDPSRPTTGRRLAYARWLTSGEHPLTARVLTNRVWMHHFGQGIVATPADFGALGVRPTHPQLLDWLASEFMRQDWSLKRLHKLIMTSAAYRQSSRRDRAGEAADPKNHLYWRMTVRRLEAEALRDAILTVSGKLNRHRFGPAVPVMADKVGQFVIGIENLNAGRPQAVIDMKGEEFRRSVYVQMRRSRPLGVLDTFDAPSMNPNCTARVSSTVATQSLMLMNSKFTVSLAEQFARRVRDEAGGDPRAQVTLAWRLAFADGPNDDQLSEAIQFLDDQASHFRDNTPKSDSPEKKQGDGKDAADKADSQLEALASFCHALVSSNQFLYVD